ncbi:MAG TPA: SLC13 family permease [Syntrophomonas sp.]|nr:SLC13 family permease [Syntrophomonas sp.]
MERKQRKKGLITAIKISVGLIAGILIAGITPPAGLEPAAMKFLGIFACMVIYLLTEALPAYALALMLCCSFVLFKVAPFSVAFGQFASETMMLLIGAFGIGAGISKCGLLNRAALYIMKLFPGTFRGQVWAFLTAGTIIGPLIPSAFAKLAIAAPFAKSVAEKLGFDRESKGAAGIFAAVWIAFGNAAPVFLSASVWCYLILGFVPFSQRQEFTWGYWLAAAWPWGAVVLVGSYLAIIFLYKPEKENILPEDYCEEKLTELGPMTRNERITAIIMVAAVILWMTESVHGIAASLIALCALGLMLSFKVLDAQDIKVHIPWDMLIFIGSILNLAALFTPLKVDKWIGSVAGPYLEPMTGNILMFVIGISVLIYLVRLVILSQIATLSVFSIALIPIAIEAGFHPWIVPFTILVSSCTWNLYFQNTVFLATLSASGEMTTHKQMVKMSLAYMLISILGLLACIPVWRLLGMVH